MVSEWSRTSPYPACGGRRTGGGRRCCIYHHNELIDGLTNRSFSITTQEWEKSIDFLTRVGQKCTPIRQEFILLSDTLGVSALVDSLNNPPIHGATESSVLGPFKTDDAPDGEWSFFQTIIRIGSGHEACHQIQGQDGILG